MYLVYIRENGGSTVWLKTSSLKKACDECYRLSKKYDGIVGLQEWFNKHLLSESSYKCDFSHYNDRELVKKFGRPISDLKQTWKPASTHFSYCGIEVR